MRDAQVDIVIRWFAGYGLFETLPDHTTLTPQRQGAERFRASFIRTVQACVAARIASGDIVHIDATLIRADVSLESLGEQHAHAVLAQDEADAAAKPYAPSAERRRRDGKQTGRYKKVCLTEPDESMATIRTFIDAHNADPKTLPLDRIRR